MVKSEVKNKFKLEGVEYRQMLVSCGKEGCKKCPHGPYWYARIKKGGKWVYVYLGKKWMSLAEKNRLDKLKREGLQIGPIRQTLDFV